MSKKGFEAQLEKLEALRTASVSDDAVKELRRALGNRNNYIAAKAAKIAAEFGRQDLVPDLLVAADRFFVDGAKTDPQCWAKNAIVGALAELGHDDPEVYLRGLRHVQPEPSWGGPQDSAGTLRGQCALAVAGCRALTDFQVLGALLEALVDPDKTVRVEAARAVARINRREAALLLRLRALVGDGEPEVLGACFTGVLAIEGEEGVDFAVRFLDRRDDAAREAALSLGLTRDRRALELLKEARERAADGDFRELLLTAIALSRLPEAFEYLTRLVRDEGSAAALEALVSARVPEEAARRLREVVEESGDARLRKLLEKGPVR
jgi:histone H3/H4